MAVEIHGNTVTFHGVNELKSYLQQHPSKTSTSALSGMNIILEASQDPNQDANDNVFTFDNLMGNSTGFSDNPKSNIVVGSGVTLSDEWRFSYDYGRMDPNIATITLDPQSTLVIGNPTNTAPASTSPLAYTQINFSEDVTAANPALVLLESSDKKHVLSNQKAAHFNVQEPKDLIQYTRDGNYDPNRSGVKFGIIQKTDYDEDYRTLTSSEVNQLGLKSDYQNGIIPDHRGSYANDRNVLESKNGQIPTIDFNKHMFSPRFKDFTSVIHQPVSIQPYSSLGIETETTTDLTKMAAPNNVADQSTFYQNTTIGTQKMDIHGNTITFHGVSELKAYLQQHPSTQTSSSVSPFSGMNVILEASKDPVPDTQIGDNLFTTRSDNTFTLDDIMGATTGFSSDTNIVVGSGVTLSDEWRHTTDYGRSEPNIASITLDPNSTLILGSPVDTTPASTNPLAYTQVKFSEDVTEKNPATVLLEGSDQKYILSNSDQKATHFDVQTPKDLIQYTRDGNYDPKHSGVKFRVIQKTNSDEEYSLLNEEQVDKLNLRTAYQAGIIVENNGGSPANDRNVLKSSTGQIPTLDFNKKMFSPRASNSSIIHVTTCFYQGTEIKTATGLKKVEDIQVGDQVITYSGEEETTRKVIWVGSTILNSIYNSTLIKIEKNALSDNVPSKDLYVTPEHCLYLNHCFVPARMLVNNRSIYKVKAQHASFIYHIELEQHSVINAHDVLTESYLDTGHNSISKQGETAGRKTWEKDAAAPLNVARYFVEPIFKELEERAIQLNIEEKGNTRNHISQDPDIQILTDTMQPISFTRNSKNLYAVIPPNTDRVYIKSKASKPSEVIGPFVDDRRNLGLLIGKISHIQESNVRIINIAPDEHNWHTTAGSSLKWTNGLSPITLEQKADKSCLVIEIVDYNAGYIEQRN